MASDHSSILTAVQWLQELVLGSLATTLAVIFTAWLGVAMLGGQIDYRRAIRLFLGMFILFGAPTISAGLRRAMLGAEEATSLVSKDAAPPLKHSSLPSFDPYAGAAVPPE